MADSGTICISVNGRCEPRAGQILLFGHAREVLGVRANAADWTLQSPAKEAFVNSLQTTLTPNPEKFYK